MKHDAVGLRYNPGVCKWGIDLANGERILNAVHMKSLRSVYAPCKTTSDQIKIWDPQIMQGYYWNTRMDGYRSIPKILKCIFIHYSTYLIISGQRACGVSIIENYYSK